jgi:DNA-binding MarR family transcriptional regulator
MGRDIVDEVVHQWRTERPDLDAMPLAVVGRILRLAGHLEQRANEVLTPFDLAIWAFDVLGTLRRSGPPYAMTPSQLTRSAMLTSGAMTNRIDRLEEKGLVERRRSSEDRRSLQVRLTAKGLKLVEEAVPVRLQEAKQALRGISAQDQKVLANLLRKMILGLEAGM